MNRLHNERYEIDEDYLIDIDRIVNSVAFRRLEYKTQVFVNHAGDHYRTRLTHTLEVAQIARRISSALGCNEHLVEAIALAHDIGHPPFGHAGERELDKISDCGFNHNIHAIEILTKLERPFEQYEGLNLHKKIIEGIIKHNMPVDPSFYYYCDIYNIKKDAISIESQIASLSDDITYCSHDIDDGIRAGFISIEDLLQIEIFGDIVSKIIKKNIAPELKINQCYMDIRQAMMYDLISNTKQSKDTIAVAHSQAMTHAISQLKDFLFQRVYHHYSVERDNFKGCRMIRRLFSIFDNDPKYMPTEWGRLYDVYGQKAVLYYIAGMTDRHILREYNDICV